MNKIYTLLILMMLYFPLLAQKGTVTGKVTDEKGNTLPGVTVLIIGTSNGTTTDVNGNFRLTVADGTLRFSFIGFQTQEIKIGGQSVINVSLVEQAQTLNEVVVVGYGTQKKKDLTTAVSTVGEKELKDRPLVSAVQALQGKAAGVQVVQPSGKPGAGLAVRVRGATSVIAGNEPLYVVDGIPTTDISGLNPGDIANMSILKDASSSAIYGARAANGVVLITTKRGQEGSQAINFNTYFGFSNIRKTIDVLDTKDYRDLRNEIAPGSYSPTWTNYTNWSDEVFSTGHNQSYQLSLAGGMEKTKYFVSAGYLSEEGMVKPARFDRYSVRVNLDNEIKSWLKIGTNINVMRLRTKDTPDNLSSGRGGVIMSTLNTPPFLRIYEGEGKEGFVLTDTTHYDPNPLQNSWENPVAYMYGASQEAIDNKLFGSFNADVRLMEGLSFKSRFGVDINNHVWDYYLDPYRTSYGRKNHGLGRSDKSSSMVWLLENTLDYARRIGKHNLTGLVGSSVQKFTYNDSYVEGSNLPKDVLVTTLWAANTVTGGTSQEEWALASFFGRATYDYESRYYLTVSLRRDGSSKLAHHWGTMPSFSAGWRISSEKFMSRFTFINDLKLRGGWGKNGNQEGIPNYTQYGLISYSRYTLTPEEDPHGPASYQSSYGNPDLKWETTSQTNLGFDLSMFNSRVIFSADFYYKKTNDLLMRVQLPSYLPITSIMTNVGSIENKGMEFNLSTVNYDKAFSWRTDFNISFNRNKVTELNFTDVYFFGKIYSTSSEVSIVKVGLPLGSFYGYVSEGVDPVTGDQMYKDVNNNGLVFKDGTFDPGDRAVIGNAQPDFTFGLTNTFVYKKWNLNFFFQGSYGNDIYNSTRVDLEGMFDSKNQSTAVLRRWTPQNTITDIPRVNDEGNVDFVANSTRFIEDGSYLRLKSLTLSYQVLSQKQIKAINKLTVYVTGQNLLTFTNYSGFDPEVSAFGNNAAEMGIDYGTYPQSRSLIIGLNLEL